MFTNPSKYYTKYNQNIKAIKGSGVLTPRPPQDSNHTTGTVKETLHDDIVYMPPLYPRTWDNDEQNTNGYLNQNDYVDYIPDIDKYYYTTQQMGEVDVKKRSDSNTNNPNYPIKLPPPLVTTKPTGKLNNKNSTNITIKNTKPSDYNNIDGDTNSQYGIGENDINRNWYDGRYLYTFSPSSLNTIYPWTTYNLLYPFSKPSDTLKYYQNSQISNITQDPLLRPNNPGENESFESVENVNLEDENKKEEQNYNVVYLTILCVLIVIYFIRHNK